MQRQKKRSSGNKQGGQPGHAGQHRQIVANPGHVVEHGPMACSGCGGRLGRDDVTGQPVARQVSEIITGVEVTEHRRMGVCCDCGRCTLAVLPAAVPEDAFVPAVAAAAAATVTATRIGRRETVRIFNDLFGLTISPASIQTLLERSAVTFEAPYTEILAALDHALGPRRGSNLVVEGRAERAVAVGRDHREDGPVQIAARRDRDAAKRCWASSPKG